MTDIPDDLADRIDKRAVDGVSGLFGESSPGTVFSTPERIGDDLVITTAAWERAGGFGFGGGQGTDAEGDSGGGGGGGGGGTSQGRPVAVIRVGSGGVDVQPVIDFTKIGITVIVSLIAVCRTTRS